VRRSRAVLAVLGVGAVAIGAAFVFGRTVRVDVQPGALDRAIAVAPDGAVLRLLPGAHDPFSIDRPLSVEGETGSVVRGPVHVLADGVRLHGVSIEGGASGVLVRGAVGVVLEDVAVAGTELHAIEVENGSADIVGCSISGMTHPKAQGVEIRNSNGHRRTIVDGCRIEGGMEGIVSHVSRVEYRDNTVRGTTLRGIAVTEMSEGLVVGNRVMDAAGAAFFCGDESHCEIRGNEATAIRPGTPGVRSQEGWGAVALYHAMMRAEENRFTDVSAGPTALLVESTSTETFPLGVWPPGWQGLLPGIFVVVALALAALAVARLAVVPWARRRRGTSARVDPGKALPILVAGFAVQSFHMLEHLVQVYQVYVADSYIRSGLAGQKVDVEWVHFLYNLAVLGFLVWAWRLVRPGGAFAGAVGRASGFLLAAFAVQLYHMAEHTAKIVQHLAWGIDPAPGIIGGAAGLVWFHFGINLTVYVGMAIPVVGVIRSALRARTGLALETGR